MTITGLGGPQSRILLELYEYFLSYISVRYNLSFNRLGLEFLETRLESCSVAFSAEEYNHK